MIETPSVLHEPRSSALVGSRRLIESRPPRAENKKPVAEIRPPRPDRKLKICMLAACPFPANHGTPGSIREMAEAITELGHEVHIVTYHFGEDIPVRGPRVHRIAPWL